jgi:hypothetical protein
MGGLDGLPAITCAHTTGLRGRCVGYQQPSATDAGTLGGQAATVSAALSRSTNRSSSAPEGEARHRVKAGHKRTRHPAPR